MASLQTQMDFGGIFKVIQIYKRYDCANFIPQTFLHSKKEIQNKKYYKENKENFKHGKVRFCLNINVSKGKEDSWLNPGLNA